MSLLFRAALLGGIAYLITRSLSSNSGLQRSIAARRGSSPRNDLHPGENNIWPTSESQQGQQAATSNAGPGA